jgi:hypothetical protein
MVARLRSGRSKKPASIPSWYKKFVSSEQRPNYFSVPCSPLSVVTENNHAWCAADNPPASRAEVRCPTDPYAFMVLCLIKDRKGFTCTLLTMGQQPVLGQGIVIVDVSRPHSETPYLIGLPLTGNQPDAETSTWLHTTLSRVRHTRPRQDSNSQSQ